jgi:phenol 2-monooxygenase
MAFAGTSDKAGADSAIGRLCRYLSQSPNSPLKRFTPSGADLDAVFDVRAVFQQSHHDLAVTAMPDLLFPTKGHLGLRDYEKAFCAIEDSKQNIYDLRGIDKQGGCLIVVRPDQYIAQVLPLDATDELAKFFNGFMVENSH